MSSPTPKWDPIGFDNHGHVANHVIEAPRPAPGCRCPRPRLEPAKAKETFPIWLRPSYSPANSHGTQNPAVLEELVRGRIRTRVKLYLPSAASSSPIETRASRMRLKAKSYGHQRTECLSSMDPMAKVAKKESCESSGQPIWVWVKIEPPGLGLQV